MSVVKTTVVSSATVHDTQAWSSSRKYGQHFVVVGWRNYFVQRPFVVDREQLFGWESEEIKSGPEGSSPLVDTAGAVIIFWDTCFFLVDAPR